MQFQISSTSDHKPFPSPDPLALPIGLEFDGWLTQIHTEVKALLSRRDSAWVNAVAELVDRAVYGRSPGITDVLQYETSMPEKSERSSFSFMLDNPGRVGQFAAVEPDLDWDAIHPKPARWERYAVFALLQLRSCTSVLESCRQRPQADGTPLFLMTCHERAGSLALEAMRGLQIGRALQQDATERSEKAKHAADKRHQNRAALLDRAIEIAKSQPFPTKKAAAEEVVNQMPKDEKGTPWDVPTVLGWFRQRGFELVK